MPAVPEKPIAPLSGILEAHLLETHLLHKIDPDYPATAKIAHVQGDVVIYVLIDKTGNVAYGTVIKGHPLLVVPALKAVRQWKYAPFVIANEPVWVESTVTIKFRM